MGELKGILFRGGEAFEEVTLEGSPSAICDLLGCSEIADLSQTAGPFAGPFRILADADGHFRHGPTAVVVDLSSSTGTNCLLGPALFVRKDKGGALMSSVQEGDMDVVKTLPWWLRTENPERATHIPRAEELGDGFDPQIIVAFDAPHRRAEVFVNAMIARREHELAGFRVSKDFFGAIQVELMLSTKEAVSDIRRFADSAIDQERDLVGAWAEIS